MANAANASVVTNTIPIKQGGLGVLDLQYINTSNVTIKREWRDDCTITLLNSQTSDLKMEFDVKSDTFSISSQPENSLDIVEIELILPEHFDISILAQEINLTSTNKGHGDFRVIANSGNIVLDKIRGENIHIDIPHGDLLIKKLMEGNANVNSRSINGKMINGDHVNMKTIGPISIGAMYTKNLHVNTSANEGELGDIKIGVLHGNGVITSSSGNITVNGVDGTLNIIANKGKITTQLNKLSLNNSTTMIAKNGGIDVNLDPGIKTSLVCSIDENSKSSRHSINIQSDTFNGDIDDTTATGHFSGVDNNKDLFGSSSGDSGGGGGGGKIDYDGARLQSLNTFSDINEVDNDSDGNNNSNNTDGANGSSSNNQASLILKSTGHIRIKTLSWMESIRRKHLG